MKTIFIAGGALIAIGAAVLGYEHYSYTTTENILQIGSIIATAERAHSVSLPPTIGWLLIGGAFALILGAWSKKD